MALVLNFEALSSQLSDAYVMQYNVKLLERNFQFDHMRFDKRVFYVNFGVFNLVLGSYFHTLKKQRDQLHDCILY